MDSIALIIPTLCRYDHFVKCIESLMTNSYSDRFDVFIGLDFPKNESQIDGNDKIKNYIFSHSFERFHGFNVIVRNTNLGAEENEMTILKELVLPNYEMWCRTDDDVVFSPNFLEYMFKCLNRYKNDKDIIAVSGYSYPCKYIVSEAANVFFQAYHVPMWGIGYWKSKYTAIFNEIKKHHCLHNKFDEYLFSGRTKELIDARLIDFVDAGLSWQDEKLVYSMSDIALAIYCTLNGKKIVYPTLSKSINEGFDGSGETCIELDKEREIYKINEQFADTDLEFNIKEDVLHSPLNREVIDRFDSRGKIEMVKTYFKILGYCVLGREKYKHLWYKRNYNKYNSFLEV